MHGTEPVTLAAFDPALMAMSFVISALGAGVGLSAAARARRRTGVAVWWWLTASAVSIGGAGIWSMHFIGMIAFDPHMQFAFDIPITLASLVVGVLSTLVGLAIATRLNSPVRFAIGGIATGLGVCGMHYLGMYAMDMEAQMSWNPAIVALSVAIALGAATLALYFALTLENNAPIALAAIVMAIGVCMMHYVGMLAMTLTPGHHDVTTLSGIDPYGLALPIIGITALVIIVIFAGLFADAGQDDVLMPQERRFEQHLPPHPQTPRGYADPYAQQAPNTRAAQRPYGQNPPTRPQTPYGQQTPEPPRRPHRPR